MAETTKEKNHKETIKPDEKNLIYRVNEFKENMSKYRELSDSELIHLVKSGEIKPFDELVRRHEVKIHDLCYKMVKNYEDARDMAQETFLKAYRNINKFDGHSKFSTWLYRIAVNTCLNYLKGRKPSEEIHEEILGGAKDDPVERYKNVKLREQIYIAIDKLPNVQRTVFTLRALEDLSYKEISEILKKPISTVKVNYHLAIKNLKNYLKGKV